MNLVATFTYCQDCYSLVVEAGPGGTTDPPPCAYSYLKNSEVWVQAIPDEGYLFTGWSGWSIGKRNPIKVVVSKPTTTIRANFGMTNRYELTIETSKGGTTNPAPGIYSHQEGEIVQIYAIKNLKGYKFDRWSGNIRAGQATRNPCRVRMNRKKTVKAEFVRR
jgi:hypothetical protein